MTAFPTRRSSGLEGQPTVKSVAFSAKACAVAAQIKKTGAAGGRRRAGAAAAHRTALNAAPRPAPTSPTPPGEPRAGADAAGPPCHSYNWRGSTGP